MPMLRKTQSPFSLLTSKAADETHRVKNEYETHLHDAGKTVRLRIETVHGRHKPDGPRRDTYRGTVVRLTIIDRDDRASVYYGECRLHEKDREAWYRLIGFRKIRSANFEMEGIRRALGEAFRHAETMFGLEQPRRDSFPTTAEFQRARFNYKSNYKATLNKWRNAKAKIWAMILSAKADRIRITMFSRMTEQELEAMRGANKPKRQQIAVRATSTFVIDSPEQVMLLE